ncbi:hypothetical protein [Bacillus salipaludis]|uniref:Uncharacterized protein n=1 Tax=Bacillus salipaludis TaxID=2547811 RepID=A0ABW8RE07_9BACI
MLLINHIQKCYRGNLTLLEGAEEQYTRNGDLGEKEKSLMAIYPFGDEVSDSSGENDFAVLDDVNTLKNLMAFAEITRYKETLLAEMTQEERNKVIELIINNLNRFEVKPIGYEIKQDSIVIAWYLNSVINTSVFSCQVPGLVDNFF